MALKFINKNLSSFGKSIDLTRHGSNAQKVALTPAAPLFALGAAINQASGGKTTTYSVWKAAAPGGSAGTTYSSLTQSLSGYQGATPGSGEWRAPLLNPETPKFIGTTAAKVLRDVAAPVADEASKALFGVKLTTLAWGAAAVGTGLLVGPPLVARALK
jgi:hypothetical protein